MVQTRSQTEAVQILLNLATAPSPIISLSLTRGFSEYATAYKWVTICSSQINEKIETDLVERLRISWNELLSKNGQLLLSYEF